MQRRSFLKAVAGAGSLGALGPGFWRAAYAAPAVPSVGPYGAPTVQDPVTGILLPPGFSVREVARSMEPPFAPGIPYHQAPDGGACFPMDDGGWVYTSNCESPVLGGAAALRFASDGTFVDYYRILTGTFINCAGGATPWGTWISCEEHQLGLVWECAVEGPGQGEPLPLLGTFSHEAVAVDPVAQTVYLSEDRPDSRLYRFTPTSYPDLTSGVLEAARLDGDPLAGPVAVTWEVADTRPSPANSGYGGHRSPTSTAFNGGEGLWIDAGWLYFTTKGDHRVWALELGTQRMEVLYDAATAGPNPPLTGVDNVTVHPGTGHLYVAEDGGSMDICLIEVGTERKVSRFLTVTGQDSSEITGPAFSPDGTRLYFSSQRGVAGGLDGTDGRTYEVTGPFVAPPPPVVPESAFPAALPIAGAALAAGAAVALHRRRNAGGLDDSTA